MQNTSKCEIRGKATNTICENSSCGAILPSSLAETDAHDILWIRWVPYSNRVPHIAHHPLHTTHCTPSIAHHPLHTIHCTPSIAHHPLHTTHCTASIRTRHRKAHEYMHTAHSASDLETVDCIALVDGTTCGPSVLRSPSH
jgi:hypothetical protein